MSTQLITIHEKIIGQKTIQAVSARELHEALGVKKDYSSWFSQHTSEWRNGSDYSVFTLEVENPSGGRPASDAALSIQMAEHIAMMTKTAKGKEVREYFRQARDERDAMVAGQRQIPQTQAEFLLHYAQALVAQEKAIAEARAVADAAHAASVETQSRVETLEASFVPPTGRHWPQDWIVATGKDRLDGPNWKVFLAHARAMEQAVPFTPPGGAFPRWFYTHETLEKAYRLATRQLILVKAPRRNIFHEPLER